MKYLIQVFCSYLIEIMDCSRKLISKLLERDLSIRLLFMCVVRVQKIKWNIYLSNNLSETEKFNPLVKTVYSIG